MSTLLLLPGDGIGPEVCAQVRRVAAALTPDLNVEERIYGGASYDAHGTPLTDEVRDAALASDAVLMGAVGGPQWANAPRHLRPEAGLLNLRKAMDVYANLRPAYCFEALAHASSLKTELVSGLDIMFVRELVGGVYFGQPRGVEDLPDGQKKGFDTAVYTTSEIERVGRVAFELARGRTNKVHSAEKSNVMESGLLWKQVITELHAREYPDVQLEHILADNCAMQLVRAPKQFDVIVTDNLFGDILSDAAAMLTGSLGMLPSAAIGDPKAGPVRAHPRLGPGHRRQGRGQSAGRHPVVRDGPALVAQAPRCRRRPGGGGQGGPGRRGPHPRPGRRTDHGPDGRCGAVAL
jgi:3-isopropylmalate dehydrogenase